MSFNALVLVKSVPPAMLRVTVKVYVPALGRDMFSTVKATCVPTNAFSAPLSISHLYESVSPAAGTGSTVGESLNEPPAATSWSKSPVIFGEGFTVST